MSPFCWLTTNPRSAHPDRGSGFSRWDFDARGVDHFLVDLRSDFGRFEELLELFAAEVIPHFR